MVIVHVSAGLGNQMFQYALYCTYVERGLKAKIELSAYSTRGERRKYELEKVFGLQPPVASALELEYIKVVAATRKKLFRQPYKEAHENFGYWNSAIKEISSGYANGYWQSEKYFIDIQEKIRLQFKFPPVTDAKNLAMLQQIESCQSVSVHIRRSDYLQNENWAIGLPYYHRAIALMKSKFSSLEFFVFSDDIDWAKQNFPGAAFHFVDFNSGENSFRDMQLMSRCRHHIIANSSFSWWGAWLNPDPEKVVIAPERWIPGINGTRDILPVNWIKLPVE